MHAAPGVRYQRALGSKREDDPAKSAIQQRCRAVHRLFQRTDGPARQQLRLGLVRDEVIGRGQLRKVCRQRRGRIDDAADSMCLAKRIA